MRCFVLALLLLAGPALADDRIVVSLPIDVREDFRAEMRDHMASLDDLLVELAAGDFQAAADIAEVRMDFGHRMSAALLEGGMTPEQIRAFNERRRAAGWQPGQGAGMGGGGQGGGYARYLPDEFRAMGMTMHEAAQVFAASARAVDAPADAATYARVLGDLQFVTSTCRSCHATFRIE